MITFERMTIEKIRIGHNLMVKLYLVLIINTPISKVKREGVSENIETQTYSFVLHYYISKPYFQLTSFLEFFTKYATV